MKHDGDTGRTGWSNFCHAVVLEVRFALRTFRTHPGFTATAVLSLAVGIGACTSMFSFLDAALLRALPYPDASALYTVWASKPARGLERSHVSRPDLDDWRRQASCFEGLAGLGDGSYTLTGDGPPKEVVTDFTSPGLFPLLRIKPLLGRWLLPSDDSPGRNHVVLLSYALWQNRYGADPAMVGRSVTLNGEPFKVVGVLPEDFHGFLGAEPEIWAPLSLRYAHMRSVRDLRDLWCVARLKPGVSPERARGEMATIAGRLARQYPASDAGWSVLLVPVRDLLGGGFARTAWLLFAAAVLVLLLACANVASLLLARSTERRMEFAVRMALGASRGRLVRQLLVESAVLSFCGTAAGVLLAAWAIAGLNAFAHIWYLSISLNGTVVLFSVGAALGSSLVFGAFPAWRAARTDLAMPIKEASGVLAGDRRAGRIRRTLVAVQVAFALVLMLGAGLLVRSFLELTSGPKGFEPRGVLTFRLTRSRSDLQVFWPRLLAKLRALPGVSSASAAWAIPYNGGVGFGSFAVSSSSAAPTDSGGLSSVPRVIAASNYFHTMGVSILAGRGFDGSDDTGSKPVAVVSRALARRLWPDGRSLGKTVWIHYLKGAPDVLTVVGVAENVQMSPWEGSSPLAFYVPLSQHGIGSLFFAVKTTGDPMALVHSVKSAVWSLDKDQPFDGSFLSMDQRLFRSVRWEWFNAIFLAISAAAGLLLACLGAAGVTAESVVARRHEIAIRMALGASGRQVLWFLVWTGMKPVLAGVISGLALTLALSRVFSAAVYGSRPIDPLTFVVATALLTLASFVACWLPALQVAGTNPASALHHQ